MESATAGAKNNGAKAMNENNYGHHGNEGPIRAAFITLLLTTSFPTGSARITIGVSGLA